LAGITIPTNSKEPFNSTSFEWDLRTISFTTTSTSHLIKFLPLDDDSNWVFSQTDTTGALYMGIDSIGLDMITGIDEINGKDVFKLYPSPNNGSFSIKCNTNANINCTMNDIGGRNVFSKNLQAQKNTINIDVGYLPKGIYSLKMIANNRVEYAKVVVNK